MEETLIEGLSIHAGGLDDGEEVTWQEAVDHSYFAASSQRRCRLATMKL